MFLHRVGWSPNLEEHLANKYVVDLAAAEQEYLGCLIKRGQPSARQVVRAHRLLHAAEGATDEEIAATLRVGLSTSTAPGSGLSRKAYLAHSQSGDDWVRDKSSMASRKRSWWHLPVAHPAGRDRWTM